MTDDPIAKVSRDLREILDLHERLITEAVSKGDHKLMPGGPAMVALGPVANQEAWAWMQDTSERLGRAYTSVEDEDPDEAWSAYQLLEFWSEPWRRELGAEYDGYRTTIATEAGFLRANLEWAWSNEPHWDEFVGDVRRAKAKLENILKDGERAQRGAPCLYDECKGAALVRKMQPRRGPNGEKVWAWSNWHCPKCHREYGEDQYESLVKAAAAGTTSEVIDGETWASTDQAALDIGMPATTIRVWLNRGELDTVCIIKGRRQRFVRVEQVRTRREEGSRRKSAS